MTGQTIYESYAEQCRMFLGEMKPTWVELSSADQAVWRAVAHGHQRITVSVVKKALEESR